MVETPPLDPAPTAPAFSRADRLTDDAWQILARSGFVPLFPSPSRV